jgi:hypothetical protein
MRGKGLGCEQELELFVAGPLLTRSLFPQGSSQGSSRSVLRSWWSTSPRATIRSFCHWHKSSASALCLEFTWAGRWTWEQSEQSLCTGTLVSLPSSAHLVFNLELSLLQGSWCCRSSLRTSGGVIFTLCAHLIYQRPLHTIICGTQNHPAPRPPGAEPGWNGPAKQRHSCTEAAWLGAAHSHALHPLHALIQTTLTSLLLIHLAVAVIALNPREECDFRVHIPIGY